MKLATTNFWRSLLVPSLSLVILFVFSFPAFKGASVPGLDTSWVFAINYFFVHGIQFGRDVVFTFGPLGFLIRPEFQSNNALIALVFLSALKFFYIFTLLKITFLIYHSATLLSKVFAYCIVMILILISDVDTLPFFLSVALVLFHFETKRINLLIFATSIASLSLLIKINVGLPPALVIGVYALWMDFKAKNIKLIPILFFFIVLTVAALWFLIYGNFLGIIDYIYGSVQFALGQSESMSLPTNNNWILILASFGCFISLPFYLKNEKVNLLYGIILLPYFSFFKYCFGRETHLSLSLFLTLLMCFFLFVIFYVRLIKPIGLLIMFLTLFLFGLNTYQLGYMIFDPDSATAPVSWFVDQNSVIKKSLEAVDSGLLNRPENELKVKKYSELALQVNKLPAEWIKEIGADTIDFYPFELSYAAANTLNWVPRPVFQSFCAYTPYLDNLDAVFFNSASAPRYILWDLAWNMQSVDFAYILNDEPKTIMTLFNHYQIIKKTAKVLLFKRNEKNILGEVQQLSKVDIAWGSWIDVPNSDENGIYRLQLSYERNALGLIKKTIYNDNLYFIYYKFLDGRIIKHRLKLPNAKTGVWISPYLSELDKPMKGEKPVAILFSAMEPQYMHPELQIQWQFIPWNISL